MPKREVTSAPWVPVPARAYTGKAPRARQHRAVGRLSAGAPRLHKSCRWRRPQSKGRSCVSGRARRDLRVRGGRGHLSERPGWPSGAPISRGSTVSMIAFGGRRGPHRSGSRCRGRPIERREAGREGCLWPNAASQGRPPDGSGGESERSTQNGRAKTFGVVVVAATPNYLRQASQNLGKYITTYIYLWASIARSLRRRERRPSYAHTVAPVLGPRVVTPGVAATTGPSVPTCLLLRALRSADGSSPWS